MSIYSMPEDMASGKSWSDMVSANMKALGLPEVKLPVASVADFKMPDFNLPDLKLPELPAGAVESSAAFAMMPMSMAASLMGAWAGAMDGALAATRKMASLQPQLPDTPVVEWSAAPKGEVVAFTPKEKTAKDNSPIDTLEGRPKNAAMADAGDLASAVEPLSATVTALADEPIVAPSVAANSTPVEQAAIAEAIFAPEIAQEAVQSAMLEAVPVSEAEATAPAEPVAVSKPAKGGSLLDMVAGDDDASVIPVARTPVPAASVTAVAPPPPAPGDTELDPVDFRKPAGIARPAAPDDLKMISGIGPKIEGILHSLGVYTFAQVASWNAAEIAWVDDYLNFKGRITRDVWIAQADALAAGGRDEYVKRFGKDPR